MKSRILNTGVTITDYATLAGIIYKKAEAKEKFTITYANSYICISAEKNPTLSECLDKFDLIHSDGIAVYWAHKFLYSTQEYSERVNGTDLYLKLFTGERKLKYFILGGPEETTDMLEKKYKVSKGMPNILSKPISGKNDNEIINNSGADILFVALGTPDQEFWIIENKEKINVPVIIAVGSGIDYLTGEKKRAPLFMRKAGFEWLYRLFQEPARLWKRYSILNPLFIFKIIKQKVNLLIKKENT